MLRALLWAVLLVALPIPYVLTDVGWVPVLRLLAMAGLTGWIWLTDGGLVAGLITVVLGLQIVLHALWIAWCAGAFLKRVPQHRRGLAVGLVAILLFVVAQWPIYQTPLSNRAARANLWGIFQ